MSGDGGVNGSGRAALPPPAERRSPELRLLLAAIDCAVTQRPLHPEYRLEPETRWIAFLTLALEHHVGGLVLAGLRRMPQVVVPPAVTEQLARHSEDILQQRRDGLAELRRVVHELARGNIAVIPLKGPALRQRLFAETAAGPSRDLDLLIRPQEIQAALAVLARCGYHGEAGFSPRQSRALLELKGQDLLHRDDGRFVIEPHVAIVPSNLGLRIDHQMMWQRSRRGDPFRLLKPEDEFLLLAVHGSKEGWTRLKWLADLAALLLREPDIDWAEVFALAHRQRARRMVELSLLVLAETFALELPPAARIGFEPRLRAMTERIGACWERPGDASPYGSASVFELSRMRRRLCDDPAARFSYLLRTLTTPRESHYRMVKLPDWIFPAYYIVKVAHDYVLWPIWTLAKRSGAFARSRRQWLAKPRGRSDVVN